MTCGSCLIIFSLRNSDGSGIIPSLEKPTSMRRAQRRLWHLTGFQHGFSILKLPCFLCRYGLAPAPTSRSLFSSASTPWMNPETWRIQPSLISPARTLPMPSQKPSPKVAETKAQSLSIMRTLKKELFVKWLLNILNLQKPWSLSYQESWICGPSPRITITIRI